MAGVNLLLHPEGHAMFQRAGMLSPAGRCRTLDAEADGYGRAEACCVMLLQPVQHATPASSHPLALLAGSAVNQDGRSSALTAPNGPAQQEVVRAALASACLAPADLHTLQMHGTGTPLGDPIEVGAAAAVLGSAAAPGGADLAIAATTTPPVALAASKATWSHAEPAAGEVHRRQHVCIGCKATTRPHTTPSCRVALLGHRRCGGHGVCRAKPSPAGGSAHHAPGGPQHPRGGRHDAAQQRAGLGWLCRAPAAPAGQAARACAASGRRAGGWR